ncbi:MAG TPA: hypothetical protein DDW52_01655, partial [Planctomycetaceae bacterium]|nr:hypothetical protein [Planctomycetaceae bacterium]
MVKTLVVIVGSLAVIGGLVWAMSGDSSELGKRNPTSSAEESEAGESQLHVYCAASNQAVLDPICEAYEELTGVRIDVEYGPSQTLLARLELTGKGDLYLPADDSFLETARTKGLVEEVLQIAKMRAGLAVKKGNPKGLSSLDDLVAGDVRFVQANPEAAAVAKLTRQLLEREGEWETLEKVTTAFRGTVTEVAADVQVGSADAGIVYDVVLHPFDDLEFVPLKALSEATSQVSLGVLSSSQSPAAALHFARFVTARDQGLQTYSEHGFEVAQGDVWADKPELSIFAGSMLRPAIEETIVQFEDREGVEVSRVYNGCGILVAQMKGGLQPDAYFACDVEFMEQVEDIFPEPIDVSQNELVILVAKGNPKKIASLSDLTKEGLRVGIGHEKQCAMGWITQNVFRETGMQTELMSNVTVQTPTGDMLVNQLRTGSLDAAVVYLSNAAGSADVLDAVRIKG